MSVTVRRKRILLVEDNEINTALVVESLFELPYEVDLAATGPEGLSKFEQGHYDLVIMDLQLPIMDGLEVAAHMRAFEARTGAARTPIIAATANAFPSDRKRCLAAGMDDYLAKPFHMDVFVRRVAQWTWLQAAR
jgi:CheY-like chemotaxis protein